MADPVSLGITIALTAANMALTASRKIEGPRLEDLKITVADYGTVLNYFQGVCKFDACPIIFAEDIREVKKRRKTKGGKFNDYTYFGTWALAVADQESDAISRIWFDKHLIYDATGPGPVTPFEGIDGFSLLDNMRFYLGSETQMPDPRMTAWVEARHGPGTNPAYRGVTYIVHEDFPLEKFGNRIPQEAVEAVKDAAVAYPYESFSPATGSSSRLWGFTFSTDYSRILWSGGTAYEIWDVASRSLLISGNWPVGLSLQQTYGISENGTIYVRVGGTSSPSQTVQAFSPDGNLLVGTIFSMSYQSNVRVLKDGQGREHVITLTEGFITYCYHYAIGGVFGVQQIVTTDIGDGTAWSPQFAFVDSYGDIWLAGTQPTANADNLYLYRLVDTGARPGSVGFIHLNVGYNLIPPGVYATHFDGHFIVGWHGSRIFKIEDVGMTVVDSVAYSFDTYNAYKQWANLRPESETIWLNDDEISLTDLSIIRTVTLSNWLAQDADGIIYDPINHALICFPQFTQAITWRYLDRISGSAATLRSVTEAVAVGGNIDPADIDATALTQTIDGYSWTQGTGKQILEPLFDAHDSILRPHGFMLEGLKLSGVSTGAIASTAFAASEEEPVFRVIPVPDTDLPRRVTIGFSDLNADQQPNNVLAQRPLDHVDAVNEVAIDLGTYVSTPAKMQPLAERWFRRRHFEKEEYQFGLTGEYLDVEPGDVRTIDLEGVSRIARLDSSSMDADGVISTSWLRDDPAIAVLSGSAGAEMDGHREEVILVPVPSKGFVLDIPLVRDADENINPLLYLAAGPYSDGTWPGASIYQSIDGGISHDFEAAGIPATNPATWGYATDALGDANPWLWDRGNSVNINLKSGTLTGTTEVLVDASTVLNLCYLGGELMQFTSAVLEGDGTWTLSGLKRGRRGTEFACADHAGGDEFLLLDAYALLALGLSDIGEAESFKAATSGRDVGTAFSIDLTFSAATLKPYAPAHFDGVKDSASGDWDFTWVRRTRIGGAWVGGTSIPLGEASEAYEIDIMNGSSVVRTIAVTAQSAEYLDADQVTDFGSTQSSITARLYQISATAGRGFVNERIF